MAHIHKQMPGSFKKCEIVSNMMKCVLLSIKTCVSTVVVSARSIASPLVETFHEKHPQYWPAVGHWDPLVLGVLPVVFIFGTLVELYMFRRVCLTSFRFARFALAQLKKCPKIYAGIRELAGWLLKS